MIGPAMLINDRQANTITWTDALGRVG